MREHHISRLMILIFRGNGINIFSFYSYKQLFCRNTYTIEEDFFIFYIHSPLTFKQRLYRERCRTNDIHFFLTNQAPHIPTHTKPLSFFLSSIFSRAQRNIFTGQVYKGCHLIPKNRRTKSALR